MNNIIEVTIILNGKLKGKDELLPRVAMILTDSYAFRIQTFVVSGASRLFNDHQLITRIIPTSVAPISENHLIYLCTRQKEEQKILCVQIHFNKLSFKLNT